jgi:hypothetical protein
MFDLTITCPSEKLEDELLLGRHIYNSMIKPADAHSAEHALSVEPWDLRLRASLLLCYCLQDFLPIRSEARLKHVFWFVENVPDWKFCGELFFYLGAGHPGYQQLKQLWLQKIRESSNFMRRVNAYMLFADTGDSNLSGYFQEFFGCYEDNPWVRALQEIEFVEQNWFHEVVSAESAKPIPSAGVINQLTELADGKDWQRAAAEHSETASFSDFERARASFASDSKTALEDLAMVAGYSWRRYSLHSKIQVDPEFVLFRLGLASWIIKNVPGSKLAKSPFFMDPFICMLPHSGAPLSEPIELLSDLWILQIQRNPDNITIAKNAAFFCTGIDITNPAPAKRISGELRKTEIGKKALRSRRRR